uniref:Uncharacterized protein n=1 Tax=Schizaphis graminum TaxID=13262 RepID=A0A2S2NRE9_SCHGA
MDDESAMVLTPEDLKFLNLLDENSTSTATEPTSSDLTMPMIYFEGNTDKTPETSYLDASNDERLPTGSQEFTDDSSDEHQHAEYIMPMTRPIGNVSKLYTTINVINVETRIPEIEHCNIQVPPTTDFPNIERLILDEHRLRAMC